MNFNAFGCDSCGEFRYLDNEPGCEEIRYLNGILITHLP